MRQKSPTMVTFTYQGSASPKSYSPQLKNSNYSPELKRSGYIVAQPSPARPRATTTLFNAVK